ncbi:MAG: hypothetical protein J4203_05715 [Candidatus Diapherotrites archaeon]|uniref:Uncharacterized protein n=1 Tax=Candidatus Iainarchaeum sp. TaxID=3101447 RepID=A0A8T4L8U8_9ARCH|nr:hypothetical protein [Candidatus Diapherotrites archaeon]
MGKKLFVVALAFLLVFSTVSAAFWDDFFKWFNPTGEAAKKKASPPAAKPEVVSKANITDLKLEPAGEVVGQIRPVRLSAKVSATKGSGKVLVVLRLQSEGKTQGKDSLLLDLQQTNQPQTVSDDAMAVTGTVRGLVRVWQIPPNGKPTLLREKSITRKLGAATPKNATTAVTQVTVTNPFTSLSSAVAGAVRPVRFGATVTATEGSGPVLAILLLEDAQGVTHGKEAEYLTLQANVPQTVSDDVLSLTGKVKARIRVWQINPRGPNKLLVEEKFSQDFGGPGDEATGAVMGGSEAGDSAAGGPDEAGAPEPGQTGTEAPPGGTPVPSTLPTPGTTTPGTSVPEVPGTVPPAATPPAQQPDDPATVLTQFNANMAGEYYVKYTGMMVLSSPENMAGSRTMYSKSSKYYKHGKMRDDTESYVEGKPFRWRMFYSMNRNDPAVICLSSQGSRESCLKVDSSQAKPPANTPSVPTVAEAQAMVGTISAAMDPSRVILGETTQCVRFTFTGGQIANATGGVYSSVMCVTHDGILLYNGAVDSQGQKLVELQAIAFSRRVADRDLVPPRALTGTAGAMDLLGAWVRAAR